MKLKIILAVVAAAYLFRRKASTSGAADELRATKAAAGLGAAIEGLAGRLRDALDRSGSAPDVYEGAIEFGGSTTSQGYFDASGNPVPEYDPDGEGGLT